MKPQKNPTSIKVGIALLILVIVGALIWVHYAATGSQSPIGGIASTTATSATGTVSTTMVSTAGWKNLANSTTGITFKYPAQLSTNYIQTVEWPPYVTVAKEPFACAQTPSGSSQVGPNGITAEETINGTDYCITTSSEGAAGSIYLTYAYTFQKSTKVLTLNFTLREPECENYPDPQMTACKNEESAYNNGEINGLADAMAQSAQYVSGVSPAQPIRPVTPVAESNPAQIFSISPASGPVGTAITITGSGFAGTDKVLFNGNVASANAAPTTVINANQKLTITIPSSMGPDCKANQACPTYEQLITPNTYNVTVENSGGTSNQLSFTVTK